MNTIMEQAAQTLQEQIGQNKLMALATRNEDGVAVRTVNIYTCDGDFYFITEGDSNITQNNQVALSVDAIQIAGTATPLGHPADEANKDFVAFVEKQLPQQFARYATNTAMRLIQIRPVSASFILLESGAGYVIDFANSMAAPIKLER